ncbi:MAG TPA: hypothetical protein VJ739_04955 [Gemmataceae bacterium]|nr:hypothetical protein [Gemmataceae bacterium]
MVPRGAPSGAPLVTNSLLPSTFRLRLLKWGRAATTWSELAGKPLTGVLAELDPRAAGSIDFEASTVTLTLRPAARVRALVLFLPNGSKDLASSHFFKGTVARSGDVTVGPTKYSFANPPLADMEREWMYLPVFLQEGPGIEYGFRPGRRVRIGFLFEADPKKATRLTVAGSDLTLDSASRSPDPVLTAREEEPAAQAKPGRVALEVYRYEHATETQNGDKSKNVRVTEVEKGERLVTPGPGPVWHAAAPTFQIQSRLRGNVPINGAEEKADVATMIGRFQREFVVPDALGSTDIWFDVTAKVGYVTVAGLRFTEKGEIKEIRTDGVLILARPGIRATDEEGNAYVSQDVRLKGEPKAITTMVKVRKK